MKFPRMVDSQWLYDHLADPDVSVLENAWIKEAYQRAHIRGAFCVPGHPYLKSHSAEGQRSPHVMGSVEFAALCRNLGLRRDRHYIVYDDYYGLFAARFWYVCRYFGLDNISILDGSWRGWLARGGPVSSLAEPVVPGSDITTELNPIHIVGLDELLQIYGDAEIQLWDTRRPGEYSGEEIPLNKRSGHIPGALNLVWTDLLTEPDREGGARFLKPIPELRRILTELGLRPDKTIITYCQSGNRAAFCNLVLDLLGFPSHRLYDASMSEWANLASPPLALNY